MFICSYAKLGEGRKRTLSWGRGRKERISWGRGRKGRISLERGRKGKKRKPREGKGKKEWRRRDCKGKGSPEKKKGKYRKGWAELRRTGKR